MRSEKMKQKKRSLSFICLMLAVLMLLPLMFSCKKEEEVTGDETTAETAEYLDDLGEFDFDGYEFKTLSITSEEGTYTKFDVEELSSSVLDNAIYYRNREIESRFNVVLKSEEDTYPKCNSALTTQSESQTHNYDLIMLINRHAYAQAIKGYIYTVDDLKYLDLEKDYYLQDVNEMSSIKGVQFLAYSEESLYTFQRTACMAYNKNMAESLGITGLYETVENGEWTFDKFFEYARLGTSVNGDGEVESYGLYGHGDYMFCTFFTAAGQRFVEKQNNTLKFTAASNEKLDEIANTEINLMKENVMGYSYDYKNPNDCYEVFKNGDALFCGTVIGKLLLLKDIEGWDYGVIPWPKYDAGQEQYNSRIIDAWIHVAPISNPDPERTGVILEALASGSAKWVFPAYYENSIQGRSLRDSDSVEMLEIIRGTRVFDWGSVTWSESLRAPLETGVFVKQNMSVATVCQTQNKVIYNLIKEAEAGAQVLLSK